MSTRIVYGNNDFQINLPIGSEYPTGTWACPAGVGNHRRFQDTPHRTEPKELAWWGDLKASDGLTKSYGSDGLPRYT